MGFFFRCDDAIAKVLKTTRRDDVLGSGRMNSVTVGTVQSTKYEVSVSVRSTYLLTIHSKACCLSFRVEVLARAVPTPGTAARFARAAWSVSKDVEILGLAPETLQ